MTLNYAQFNTQLALMSQYDETDPNFVSNLPSCIDYATDRIVRELNLLSTVTSNSSLQTSTTSRVVNLGALNPIFNVLQDINLLTPAGVTNPDLATRVPLTIQSRCSQVSIAEPDTP